MPPKQTPDSSGGSASTAINLDSSILTSLSSLLAASQKTLSNPSLSSSSSSHIPSDAPLPLDLLHDTATLLRAQTTKLGIALRPPVTAEAVDAILREIRDSILPAMLFAVDICVSAPNKYGSVLVTEVRRRVKEVVGAVGGLAAEIQDVQGSNRGRELVSVGKVWSTCDAAVGLKALGLTGVVRERVSGCVGILEDAEGELRAYVNGEEDDAGWDDDEDENEKDGTGSTPRDKSQAEKALKRLRTYALLLKGLVKKRLSGDSALKSDVGKLDGIPGKVSELAETVDDMVIAFVEGDDEEGMELLSQLDGKAVGICEIAEMGDDGKEDGGTAWFKNCKAALEKKN